jgi:protein TonB
MSTMAAPPGDWQLESGEIEHLHTVREAQSRNLRRALLLASMSYLTLMVLVMLGLLAKRNVRTDERVVTVPYRELQAPPSLQQTPPTVTVAAPTAAPTAGIPLPTEEEQIEEEQTIATQEELSQAIGVGETAGTGDSLVIAPPQEEALPGFGEYVYVEEFPEAIKKVTPDYPDLARQSSMEGQVVVQALVGKDGRVKQTKVVKSNPVFDQAAVKAVEQYVFKPALSNNKPVAVWVAVPIRFVLN